MNVFRPLLPSLLAVLSLACAGCGDSKDTHFVEEAEVAPHVGDPIAEADALIAKRGIKKDWADWRLKLAKPTLFGFPTDKKVHWILETSKGRIVARLWHDVAPIHVSSFVYLTRLGFYDGLTLHRVVKGFMAQGGDPYSLLDPRRVGGGWPGKDYKLPLEVRDGVNHDRPGLLSTARTGEPNSGGSQFFITFRATPDLDRDPKDRRKLGYTLFGEVVEGMEVVRAMEAVGAVPRFDGDSEAPSERIVIQRATVELR